MKQNTKIRLKKNQVCRVKAESISDQGYGIACVDGKTVFVKNLLPGEEAEIRIIKDAGNYAVAVAEKRLSDSPERTEPKCPKAGICGGCSFQHMSYEAQLAYKTRELRHLFGEVSKEIEVKEILGMEDPWNYRNKAQFPIAVKDGQIVSGFYRPHSNDIVEIRNCPIQAVRINEVFAWLQDHMEVKTASVLRHLYIRESSTGQIQVVFIGRENRDLERLSDEMVRAFPEITSVLFNRNEREDNVILGDDYSILYGKDTLTENCLGLKISLHFKSFYQVNPRQMEVLYSQALQMADLSKEDQVIELYSGTGTIGLLAAREAGHVTGVEIVPEAVKNANENRKANGIENAEFVCMDASEFARENRNRADVVMVDPPRKGMSSQGIEDICRLSPERIVYISCNPRTLARDLKVFLEEGYACPVIQPVDMFAHTSGVECVALLKMKEKDQSGSEE